MKEWNEFDPKEIVRKYRQFVYETGAVDAGKGKTMDKKIVEKARKGSQQGHYVASLVMLPVSRDNPLYPACL